MNVFTALNVSYLINLLKPNDYVMHYQIDIQQMYALPTLLGFV
jgi:hypothetical protein